MADPSFSSVVLLLNFQGTTGSTTITDDSDAAKTATAEGNAQIDATDGDFSGGCLLLDGTGDKVGVPAESSTDTDFLWGTADFTIETFLKTSDNNFIVFDYLSPGNPSSWYLDVTSSGYLRWRVVNEAGTTISIAAQTANPVNTGAKVHIAVSRVSGTLYLLANGAVVASAADATDYAYAVQDHLYIGGWWYGGSNDMAGKFGPVRATKGVGRYAGAYSVPATPFDTEGLSSVDGLILVSGPLAQPELRGAVNLVYGSVSVSGPLANPAIVASHDFTGKIDTLAPTTYVMDLVTPGGLVRVPISSWQATLQTDVQSYVQCVIPAATDWVPDIEAATEFFITRRGTLLDGSSIEYEMARAPAQTVSLDGGAFNYTATISGYTTALDAVEDPPTALDRTLTGVRTTSRNSGNVRVRCNIDWLLRPGHRAYLNEEAIVVRYVNYYAPGFDQYMDVGDRAT